MAAGRRRNRAQVRPDGKQVETYFHSDAFNQPNDLAIATDGTIYASDRAGKRMTGRSGASPKRSTAASSARR